jgi:hypothetical protein
LFLPFVGSDTVTFSTTKKVEFRIVRADCVLFRHVDLLSGRTDDPKMPWSCPGVSFANSIGMVQGISARMRPSRRVDQSGVDDNLKAILDEGNGEG